MTELQRDSPYFEKVVPIQMYNGAEELKSGELTFRILPGTRPTTAAGQFEKVVHFEITDDSDPYFLYVLDVGENDFHHLKRDQALLVEFNVFPTKLIELIDMCMTSAVVQKEQLEGVESVSTTIQQKQDSFENIDKATATHQSKYVSKLDAATGQFQILEANLFKHLVHITLQMRPGNDAAVKHYLASRLSYTYALANRLDADLKTMTHNYNVAFKENQAMTMEIQDLRTHMDVDIQALKSSHGEEVSRLQMEHMQAMAEERNRSELVIEGIREELDAARAETQTQHAEHETVVRGMQMERSELEYEIKDLNRKIELTEMDRDQLIADAKSAAEMRSRLDERRGTLETDLIKALAKIEQLEMQLADKDGVLKQMNAVEDVWKENQARLVEQLDMYKTNCGALQDKLKQAASEVVKGNQGIARLQQEVAQLRDKMKVKSDVIRKQEALVTELRGRTGEGEGKLLLAQEAHRVATQEVAALQQRVKDTEHRIEESALIIANNQEVISYLNEEINKWQLGMRIQGDVGLLKGPSSTPAPTTDVHKVSPYSYNDDQNTASSADYPIPQSERRFGGSVARLMSSQDREVYAKGMSNLGLGQSLTDLDLDLGLDFDLLGLEAKYNTKGERTPAGRSAKQEQVSTELDIEGMDYYSTGRGL